MKAFHKTHYSNKWHYLIMFTTGYVLGFISNYLIYDLPLEKSIITAGWFGLTMVLVGFIAFESGRRIKK